MNPILLQVFNRPWYIDHNSAVGLSFAVKALLDGKVVFETDKKTFEPRTVSLQATKLAAAYSNNQTQKSRMVSVIPIQGPLMKKDQYCGPVGMDTIGRYIQNADRNPEIDAIILDIDSPGGTVAGTANLGKIIRDTKKPIIAFVNELAASAAYWLASQCDEIIASDDKAEVGSIGVMITAADVQPAWEKQGVVFHEIYADGSEEKNQDWKEIRQKKYEGIKKRSLNPLREYFVAAVKSTRGDKIKDESIFKGRVDFADKAIKNGLIDRIASFDETVEIAINMADSQKSNGSQATNTQKPISSMKKRPLLEAALGVESLEESDGGSFLNEAQLDALEEKMAGHQSAIDAIAGERDQAKIAQQAAEDKAVQDATAKDAEISTLKEEKAELANQVVALTKNPAEAGAAAFAKTDVDSSASENPMLKELNACSNAKERLAVVRKYQEIETSKSE